MMFLRFRFILFLAVALPCVLVSCNKDDEEEPYDVTVDFQNASIPKEPGYVENAGAGLDGIFTEGIISFPNYYNTEYKSWSGFAYSQKHDITTPGYDNQYSVYVPNDPQENKFMVAYLADPSDGYSPKGYLTFSQPVKDISFDVANATYTALAMKDGNAPAIKFTDKDSFKLNISVTTIEGTETVTISLGEGTTITNVWNPIQLKSKGVSKIEFSLISTDNDPQWGMRTPAYFCIDNIKARTVK